MNESLAHFRSVCQRAFAFLVSDFQFHEAVASGDPVNPYVVEFSNDDISLRVVGEGYGTVARVEYITQDGRSVPSSALAPDWQPNAWRKKPKRPRPNEVSQDEQIQAAAALVRARDQSILRRDYSRLSEAADRWQKVLWTDPDFTDTTCLKKLKESGNGWKDKAAVRGGVSAADS